MSYACIYCSSSYDSYTPFCTGCMQEKTVILEPRRPPSAMRGELHVQSARALTARAWTVASSSAYPELLVGKGAIVSMYGAPGSGKSTLVTRWLDGMQGAVVLYSAEERLGPTVSARLSRLGIHREDFSIVGQASVDELVAVCRKVKAIAVGIDSIGLTTLQPTDLRRFIESSGVSALAFVQQVAKDGTAAGSNAYLHEADVVISVADMLWTATKSRYQQTPLAGVVIPPRAET